MNKSIIILLLFFLAAGGLLLKNNQKLKEQEKCGVESCHGMDITCGPNVPEACTLTYQLGDFCRQFVKCEVAGGQCKVREGSKFQECNSCVQKCEAMDVRTTKKFECEFHCREFFKNN